MCSDILRRVAILVDGDNTPLNILGDIETHAQSLGEVVHRRVYGVASHMNSWRFAKSYVSIDIEGGKNATDFSLSMDAVEIAAKGEVDIIVICTNDSDFVHVARKLSSMGIETQGVGTDRASAALEAQMDGYLRIPYRSVRRIEVEAMLEGMERGDLSDADCREAKIAGLARDLLYHTGGPEGLALSSLRDSMRSTFGVSKDDLPTKSWHEFLAMYPRDFSLVGDDDKTRVMLLGSETGKIHPSDWQKGILIESQIDRLICHLLRKCGRKGEMSAVELAALMEDQHGVTAQNLPTQRWSTYLEGKPEQFALLVDGPFVSVRLIEPEQGQIEAA